MPSVLSSISIDPNCLKPFSLKKCSYFLCKLAFSWCLLLLLIPRFRWEQKQQRLRNMLLVFLLLWSTTVNNPPGNTWVLFLFLWSSSFYSPTHLFPNSMQLFLRPCLRVSPYQLSDPSRPCRVSFQAGASLLHVPILMSIHVNFLASSSRDVVVSLWLTVSHSSSLTLSHQHTLG